MKRTKRITGRYNFTVTWELSGKTLTLDGYTVDKYPLTYTIADCLEHFCDGVGWELATCHYHYERSHSTDGTAVILRPFKRCTFARTLRRARALYREVGAGPQW